MSWRQAARIVFAAIGLGTAAAVYHFTRPRPVVQPPRAAAPIDAATTLQTGQGTDVRYRDGAQSWKLDYQATKDYPDGRVVREGVHVIFSDGTEAWADHAEISGRAVTGDAPGALSLSGHFRLKGTANELVESDTASYADATKIATIPGALTFSRGAMHGTGTGGTFHRDTGVFTIASDASVTLTPADGGGPITATAHTMTYTRDDKSMRFDGDARIGRQSETLAADTAVLHLSDDEQEFTAIDLVGHAGVTPAPGQTSALPAMKADAITLNFYPGGQALQHAQLSQNADLVMSDASGPREITAATIVLAAAPDGKTITRLEGTDHVVVHTPRTDAAPARTIDAATLVATGDDAKGLTAAVFNGGVTFKETVAAAAGRPASTRTGTSDSLTLKIEGQLDAIDEARFIRRVKFTSEGVTGDADLGTYYAAKNELDLMPVATGARRAPHVTDGSMTVDATRLVKVFLDTQNLDAFGDVKTLTSGNASSTPPKDAGFFDTSDATIGTADEFHYDDGAKTTRYVATGGGVAVVRQKDRMVSARDVLLHTDTQDLEATGNVHSEMPVANDSSSSDTASGGAAASPAPTPARSASGAAATEPRASGSGTRAMGASSAPASSSARGSSNGSGTASSSGSAAAPGATTKYTTTSDTLVYNDAARTATYVGAPAIMKSSDGETDGTTIVLTLAPDTRTIDTLEATTNVYFKMVENAREGRGDRLLYEAASNQYTFTGGPLALKSREDDGSCSVSKGSRVLFWRDTRAAEWPEAPGGFATDSTKISCADPLPK